MPRFECPSWGCHGEIVTEAEPRHGVLGRCREPEGEQHWPVCGREMVWNAFRLAWAPVAGPSSLR